MERKKKIKTNHRPSWLMLFRLRMLYMSIVLSSLFFFLTSVPFFSFLSSVYCGTIVTRRCGIRGVELCCHLLVSVGVSAR